MSDLRRFHESVCNFLKTTQNGLFSSSELRLIEDGFLIIEKLVDTNDVFVTGGGINLRDLDYLINIFRRRVHAEFTPITTAPQHGGS